MNSYLDYTPEVKKALQNQRPVVALESTLIAHGMPYPQNLETAQTLEKIIREIGATPATIAILKGRLKVGLNESELLHLAKNPQIAKISRRDLPYVVAQQKDGATTVAATMIIAAQAGIPIFATGGIGGVHRGAEQSMDISADLQELARTPVAVVSAGAKAILDLGLTLEYLETMGVPVIGYQTEDFPAFYFQKSGFQVDYRLDTPRDIAHLINTQRQLNFSGGMLIANPIPVENALEEAEVEGVIQTALQEADLQNIKGKALTPFLLDKIKTLTRGESLEANRRLVFNNARLAAEIAMQLSN